MPSSNSNDRQAEFLLAEYKQLHEAVNFVMGNEKAFLKAMLALLAGATGSILVAVTRGLSGDLILLCVASAATFSSVFAILGCLLLIESQRGLVLRLRAINAIRRYFLEFKLENARFFLLPVTDFEPHMSNMPLRSSVVGMLLLIFVLFGSSMYSWLLYLNYSHSVSGSLSIIAAFGASATIFLRAVIVKNAVNRLIDRTAGLKSLEPRKEES